MSAWKQTKVEQRNQNAFDVFYLWRHAISLFVSLDVFWIVLMHDTRDSAACAKVCAIQINVVASTVYDAPGVHQQPARLLKP